MSYVRVYDRLLIIRSCKILNWNLYNRQEDIVEETVSSAQQTDTLLVPRGNEGEQRYGSKNLYEEICENKFESAPEETSTNTLVPQDLLNFDYSDPAL
jgi:hypothetical protein